VIYLNIPKYIKDVLKCLSDNGYEGYMAGGCVRDSIMGNIPNDYDVTTNATPDEMLCAFNNFKVIPTGLKHGTVTVVSDGENIEVTTYRIDGEYVDNRHPQNVTFTSNLKDDLARRDFTVNAMAMDVDGNIMDFYGLLFIIIIE
jgi:tRNA nucleotidyltransferase (CCA-adding enzyme)